MPIDGYPNLINPATDRTTDERRASAIKAGQKSGEARRRKKTFAEVARAILDSPEDNAEVLELLQKIGLEGTKRDAITLAQIAKAAKGDTDAFRIVRDTVGEKPRDELEIGNLASRPFETLDLSKLTDEQLKELVSQKAETQE